MPSLVLKSSQELQRNLENSQIDQSLTGKICWNLRDAVSDCGKLQRSVEGSFKENHLKSGKSHIEG